MLKLYGFPASNYYNMAKMALLEKGADYEDVRVFSGSSEDYLAKSAMGKVPCLETPDGFLSETSVILDYIEDTVEGPSLYPADPYERARVKELVKYSELYLELPARRCYGEAFFGAGPVSQEVKDGVRPLLERGCHAIARRGSFSPYLSGETLTCADIVFLHSFPMAAGVANSVFGWDLFEELPQAKALLDVIQQRPVAIKVAQDTADGMKEFRDAYGIKG